MTDPDPSRSPQLRLATELIAAGQVHADALDTFNTTRSFVGGAVRERGLAEARDRYMAALDAAGWWLLVHRQTRPEAVAELVDALPVPQLELLQHFLDATLADPLRNGDGSLGRRFVDPPGSVERGYGGIV